MHLIRLAVLLCLPMLAPLAARADLTTAYGSWGGIDEVFVARLDGAITAADLVGLHAARARMEQARTRILLLASEGGDLRAAMEIGRYVRAQRFDTAVPPNAACLSVCVFILAAGIDKTVQGRVGIHRPYFPDGVSGSTATALRTVKADAEAYLATMNIPVDLVERMFSIEPAAMRLLTASELRDYRLNSMDYIERESKSNTLAGQYGLSREAYVAGFTAPIPGGCNDA